ncbi:MAG: ParB/RepB/Spo0J family partition protein [Flavobacteriales bacterium]|nr:ParB/RepB/Spo0J family partition protein [Flavobacteriales bacterium]
MAKKQALGRGLSALLSEPDSDLQKNETHKKEILGGIAELSLEEIHQNPFQPRTNINTEQLEELAASIVQLGVIQPVTVRRVKKEHYELIAGQRRYLAAQMAGLHTIPAYVRLANDQAMLELALVENIQRQEMDPIEIALSYQRLIDECRLTQEEMSNRVGKKRSTITNYLRLLKLNDLIQAGLRDNMISMGHARALINIDDKDAQLFLYEGIIARRLSVREVEQRVKQLKDSSPAKKKSGTPLPFAYQRVNDDLSKRFKAKTEIQRNRYGRGKIIFHFASDEELDRIAELLNNE